MAEYCADEVTLAEAMDNDPVVHLPVKHWGMASRAAELVTLARALERYSDRQAIEGLLDAIAHSLVLNDMLLAIDARNPREFTSATWDEIERIEGAARDARHCIRSCAGALGIEL